MNTTIQKPKRRKDVNQTVHGMMEQVIAWSEESQPADRPEPKAAGYAEGV